MREHIPGYDGPNIRYERLKGGEQDALARAKRLAEASLPDRNPRTDVHHLVGRLLEVNLG